MKMVIDDIKAKIAFDTEERSKDLATLGVLHERVVTIENRVLSADNRLREYKRALQILSDPEWLGTPYGKTEAPDLRRVPD